MNKADAAQLYNELRDLLAVRDQALKNWERRGRPWNRPLCPATNDFVTEIGLTDRWAERVRALLAKVEGTVPA
jgi:hypothetical protein